MDNMKFKVADLIRILKKNKANHALEFLEANAGYRATVVKTLEKELAKIRKGGRIVQYIISSLEIPLDYTGSYSRVISMLEMTTDIDVPLTEQEFSRYVNDDWEWSDTFKRSYTSYNVVGKRALK